VTIIVMPLFALANAGVRMDAGITVTLLDHVALGVIVGLLIGKPAGVLLGSGVVVRLRVTILPEGVRWPHMIGVGFLAGIGFTMSLFITGLAFDSAQASTSAKIGILCGSALAGVIGWLVLRGIQPVPHSLKS
jgi:NhaA family Na+:H+ antiporter